MVDLATPVVTDGNTKKCFNKTSPRVLFEIAQISVSGGRKALAESCFLFSSCLTMMKI